MSKSRGKLCDNDSGGSLHTSHDPDVELDQVRIVAVVTTFDAKRRLHRIVLATRNGGVNRVVRAGPDFIGSATTEAMDAPFRVVPVAVDVEFALYGRKPPGEERDALADPEGLEEPFRLTVKLAGSNAPFDQGDLHALEGLPESRAELVAVVGDQKSWFSAAEDVGLTAEQFAIQSIKGQ